MSSNYSDQPPSNSRRSSRPHVRLNSSLSDILAFDSTQPQPPRVRPPRLPLQIQTSFENGRTQQSQPLARSPMRKASTDSLVPPRPASRSRRRYRDFSPTTPTYGFPTGTPQSATSSRRSSISSVDSHTGLVGAAALPEFASSPPHSHSSRTSRASSLAGSDEEAALNTQTVSEKFSVVPSSGLLIYPSDVETDDWMHDPMKGGKDKRDYSYWNKRSVVNVGGVAFIGLGVFALFVIFPILTFVRPLIPVRMDCANIPDCIRDDLPLLKNVRTSAIDPETPMSLRQHTARDGSTMNLVFSDEFNTPGRTFYENDDAYFQGMDFWYGATYDLEWYDPDAITTGNGTLNIQFDKFENHNLEYRSGMLQSWNQFCFKGGYIEASLSLPGRGDTVGFWPGFWTMGNLGRPGYQATTDGMWPYSYHDECDYGITPNQSSSDGLSWLPGMKLPACTCFNQDHPTPGRSRSSPEIDAIEASTNYLGPGETAAIGSASQSFQLAPFDIWYQPNYDYVELYDPTVTEMNTYRGGPIQQAFSGLSNLNNDWYDGTAYQTYGFEYKPGADGYISFFIGGERTWTLEGASIAANGNVGQRIVPEEPMTIIANFGMSKGFSAINATIMDLLPATMSIDYIRLFQSEGSESLTCDPPGYETTQYIAEHPKAYLDWQATSWETAGYQWPTNSLMDGC